MATVEYKFGWVLVIPKQGLSSLLFLEWVAQHRAGINLIHKVIDSSINCLQIRMNCTKEEYLKCAKYINIYNPQS
jgi:hypothetical protein